MYLLGVSKEFIIFFFQSSFWTLEIIVWHSNISLSLFRALGKKKVTKYTISWDYFVISCLFPSISSSLPVMALSPAHIQYCRDHYGNSHCEQGCDSAPCGWDGSDCFKNQSPVWAKGTLVFHTRIPHQRGTFTNSSLLWAASVLLQSPVILRGSAPLATEKNLFDLDHQQLANTLTQASADDSDG